MSCPRCKGVMTQEVFEDLLDDTGNLSFNGWRCLTCGEILDPVIANNRGAVSYTHLTLPTNREV